ncbi:MAG: type IV secretory system conjugative DNA transfer family protein [Bacilli bacterium]|nr:type IV secretory system conjugative DNA transfer family protein [Bacilli bacterium]
MKFRITKRDFIIFVIFLILLLLLSSILVVNFYSLGNDGVFYGLNPIKGLLPPYLPVTLIVFVAAIIVIFVSVSSYIFDKEKGKGIGLLFGEKKEKGYSRWATDKEMKEGAGICKVNPSDEKLSAAGVPIINNGKEIWCDNGYYHSLIIGSTGCGKSESIVKPTVKLLAKKGESMVVTDPKGELYKESAEVLKKMGYNIITLNFREPNHGNAWNPLSLPYRYYREGNKDKAIELLEDIGANILIDPKNQADPFWEKSACDYFSGIALGLFEDATEEEVNLNSINYVATVGEERVGGSSRYINEYFKTKSPDSSANIFASGTINSPNETKGGIISMFKNKIRIFSTRDNLSEMLSYSDFDMRKIGKEKTAVFIIIHDEKTTYHSLATIFIKQCYECLIDVAQENGGKLKYRTNFLLDEFANMPPIRDVDSMVSAARSRDIRFLFIIQNFAQLKDVYGENVAEIIKGNCGNIIYLISTEMSALEEISKLCGEVKSKEKEKTASTPLVTITDLQKMKLGEAIYKRLRMDPFKTKLAPDFDVKWGFENIESHYPTREPKPPKLFDVKAFVDEHRKNNMPQGMGPGMGMGMPPFGDNFNPFGGGGALREPTPKNEPIDFDSMMKDIEKRIQEIEEEERKEQLEKEAKTKATAPVVKEEPADFTIKSDMDKIEDDLTPINIYNEEPEKIDIPEVVKVEKNPVKEDIKETPKPQEKPIINVDSDSVIVNENVVTDDEFFDDFFGDD